MPFAVLLVALRILFASPQPRRVLIGADKQASDLRFDCAGTVDLGFRK